ncbi:MAG: hypothetical protein IJ899_13915 [Blautia sp.]|nr:hypothetical protein [Blautia sp.]
MIDYDEEIKKFEPCLDVTDTERVINDQDLTDILDILQDMLRQSRAGRRTAPLSSGTDRPRNLH